RHAGSGQREDRRRASAGARKEAGMTWAADVARHDAAVPARRRGRLIAARKRESPVRKAPGSLDAIGWERYLQFTSRHRVRTDEITHGAAPGSQVQLSSPREPPSC